MKLTDKWSMSRWAYCQCLEGNDTQEMRDLITHQWYAYKYCYYIKNIPEMRIYISKDLLQILEIFGDKNGH